MQLPMWNFKSQVLEAVNQNQVVIVCGETGWYVQQSRNSGLNTNSTQWQEYSSPSVFT